MIGNLAAERLADELDEVRRIVREQIGSNRAKTFANWTDTVVIFHESFICSPEIWRAL